LSERGDDMRFSAEPRLSQLIIGASTASFGLILIGSAVNVRFSERSDRPTVSLDMSGAGGLRSTSLNMSSKVEFPKFKSASSFGGMAVLA
jgi:hypothetical protein